MGVVADSRANMNRHWLDGIKPFWCLETAFATLGFIASGPVSFRACNDFGIVCRYTMVQDERGYMYSHEWERT